MTSSRKALLSDANFIVFLATTKCSYIKIVLQWYPSTRDFPYSLNISCNDNRRTIICCLINLKSLHPIKRVIIRSG